MQVTGHPNLVPRAFPDLQNLEGKSPGNEVEVTLSSGGYRVRVGEVRTPLSDLRGFFASLLSIAKPPGGNLIKILLRFL